MIQHQVSLNLTQEYIQEINEENNHYKIITNNQINLLNTIEELQNKLELSSSIFNAFTNPNFSSSNVSKIIGFFIFYFF